MIMADVRSAHDVLQENPRTFGAGPIEHIGRPSFFENAAIAQHHDPVARSPRKADLVRDKDE